jgi:AcrR family transcriptional regulator
MAAPSETTAARRAAILDAATGVFLRYGFKKTSMDDLARAVGLSRQGLYLQFPTKDALFKEAVLNVIATTRAAGQAALARADLDFEERLLNAFEAVHGHAIGKPGSEHMNELLETATELVGPVFDELEQGLVTDVARVLRGDGIADKWKPAGVSAKDLAEHLYVTSYGVKHRVSTHADYRDRMRIAVRIVCRGPGR